MNSIKLSDRSDYNNVYNITESDSMEPEIKLDKAIKLRRSVTKSLHHCWKKNENTRKSDDQEELSV